MFNTLLAPSCNWTGITHPRVQCCTAVALFLCRFRNSFPMKCYDKLLEGPGFCREAEARLYSFLAETQCPEVHYYATTTIATNPVSSTIIAMACSCFHTAQLHWIQVQGTWLQLQARSDLLPHPFLQSLISHHPTGNFPPAAGGTLRPFKGQGPFMLIFAQVYSTEESKMQLFHLQIVLLMTTESLL